MKRRLFFIIFFSFISVSCILGDAGASTWEDIFQNLSDHRRITPGVQMDSPLYNASLQFTIFDGDGIANNFSGSDTIDLYISGNGESLSFNGTKAELVDWSKKHSEELLQDHLRELSGDVLCRLDKLILQYPAVLHGPFPIA